MKSLPTAAFTVLLTTLFTACSPEPRQAQTLNLKATLENQLVNRAMAPTPYRAPKYTLFYYSAHWCPPCRQFTPRLVNFYQSKYNPAFFEVIFVSGDRSEQAMKNYMQEANMPWPATKFASATSVKLRQAYQRDSYIPYLSVVDRDGKLLFDASSEGGAPNVLAKFKTMVPEGGAMLNTLNQAQQLVHNKNLQLQEAEQDFQDTLMSIGQNDKNTDQPTTEAKTATVDVEVEPVEESAKSSESAQNEEPTFSRKYQNIELKGTMVTATNRKAFINDGVYKIGETIKNTRYKLINIEPRFIRLNDGKQTIILKTR